MAPPFDLQGTLTVLCTACGTDNHANAVICQKCGVSLAPTPGESLMQSIGQNRQKDAKKAREKAAAGGMVAGLMVFYLLRKFGFEFGGWAGYEYFRLIGAACFGVAGAAIGRWVHGA